MTLVNRQKETKKLVVICSNYNWKVCVCTTVFTGSRVSVRSH